MGILDRVRGLFPASNFSGRSDVVDRLRFARRAGLQYGTKRDVYEVAGYPAVQDLEGTDAFEYYWGQYQRNEVAARIVDLPPRTCWSKGVTVAEYDRPDGTMFTQDFDALQDRLGLARVFERTDRLTRLGRYGLLLIGTDQDATVSDLETPMPMLRGVDSVTYLSPYSERNARIVEYVDAVEDPRFGLPLMYEIDLSAGIVTGRNESAPQQVRVHWSRVIHCAEGLLEDEVFGRPALQRVYNRLIDLEKVAASTGEAYWQLAARILTASVDPNTQMSDGDFADLGTALEEIQHDLRRQILAQGIELKWLDSTPPDPMSAAQFFMAMVAVGGDVPKRILFGTETGERASSEDMKMWLGSMAARQHWYCEPVIVRAFVDRLVEYGAMTAPTGDEYMVEWEPLFTESSENIADTNVATANAAKAITPLGGDPSARTMVDEDGRLHLIPTESDG